MTLNLLQGQRLPMSEELKTEIAIIKAETKCMIDKLYEVGKGDLAVGAVKGIDMGVIDIPFAPSKFNNGKMMPARDNNGAVRYLKFGNVPFTQELKNYNLKKLEDRAKFEGREIGFQMTVDDIFAVGKGRLIGRPEK
jgi:methylaspartate mutase epsilon subunit